MSSCDGGGTTGEGAPAHEEQAPEIPTTSQQTPVPLPEGWGSVSTNGDPDDEQVDMKGIRDEVWLTKMNQFFPEPVWSIVLGKLKKKSDIDSCFYASPFFENLLLERREREVVLPTVFGILARKYSDRNNKDKSYKETNLESIPWKMRWWPEFYRMTGILKCRLVCKQWNEVIEAIHHNEDAGHYKMELDLDLAENNELGSLWGTVVFDTESRVVNFLEHFQATHYDGGGRVCKKCPFFGRAVRVGDEMYSVDDMKAYFNLLLELFEKFGEQVWYLQFNWMTSNSIHKLVDVYSMLKQIVALMPNLKVLRVGCDYCPSEEKMMQGLEGEIQRNPFQTLANLEMISIEGIPGVLANHLVSQNRQIRWLEIKDINFNGHCFLFGNKMSRLSQLCLVDVKSLEILESLERYPAIFHLTKLGLRCNMRSSFVTCSRIFNAFNSKINSDICTELVLELPCPNSLTESMSVLQDSQKCRLKFGNLQRCQITAYSPFSLDFLLSSKNSLREIEMRIMMLYCDDPELKDLRNDQVTEIIKILDFEDVTMKNSNIAKDLPALRKLIIEFKTLEKNYKELIRHYSILHSGVIKVTREELRESKSCEVTGQLVMQTKINTF